MTFRLWVLEPRHFAVYGAVYSGSTTMPDDARKPTWDKSKLPSRHSTSGPERAPHRAMFYAMGVTEEQLAQPIVGVATTWNEAAPCHISLSRQEQAATRGGASSGGEA